MSDASQDLDIEDFFNLSDLMRPAQEYLVWVSGSLPPPEFGSSIYLTVTQSYVCGNIMQRHLMCESCDSQYYLENSLEENITVIADSPVPRYLSAWPVWTDPSYFTHPGKMFMLRSHPGVQYVIDTCLPANEGKQLVRTAQW